MWDPRAERMSADERADLQARRLDDLVGRLAERSPLYRERLAGAGVGPGARVGLDGLADLPFTTKQDLWDGYPWGLLAVPSAQVVRVHGSSGTGGRPTLVAYSRTDLDIWAQVCARALGCAGAGPGTITHNAYGYGLFTGGLGTARRGRADGLHAWCRFRLVRPSARSLLLRDLRPEVLCCTPSYAARLGEVAGRGGGSHDEISAAGRDLRGRALERGHAGPDRGPAAAEGARHLRPLRRSSVPGVACECVEAQAGLHVNEDHFLVEVVDPGLGAAARCRVSGASWSSPP